MREGVHKAWALCRTVSNTQSTPHFRHKLPQTCQVSFLPFNLCGVQSDDDTYRVIYMSLERLQMFHGIWRWREAMFGLFMACCGMIWAVGQQGVLAAIGTSISIVGALIIFAGIQRTRFRVNNSGPGVVHADLSHVTYYGPRDGGTVAVDALEKVALDPTVKPAQWVMQEVGGQPISIPTDAENAELLFDVFASLDGIKTDNMLSKLRSNPHEPVVIWDETQRQLH